MTIELFILAGIVAGLWFAIIFLRVPAFAAFFSLLVGQMLSSEMGVEAYDFVGGVFGIGELRYVQLGLLLLPFLLTVLFLRGRTSKSKLMVELVPALFVACTIILLSYPLLQPLRTLVDIATVDQIDRYRSIVLLAAGISGLLSAWTFFPKPHKEKHGKKKH